MFPRCIPQVVTSDRKLVSHRHTHIHVPVYEFIYITGACFSEIVWPSVNLWQPGSQSNPPDSNGSTTQEENSKYEQLHMFLVFSFPYSLLEHAKIVVSRNVPKGVQVVYVVFLFQFFQLLVNRINNRKTRHSYVFLDANGNIFT